MCVRYFDAAGHWLTYILVITGILYVAGITLVFLRRAWKRAGVLGFSGAQLRRVVKITASQAIAPMMTIAIGFFMLLPLLGIPLSWWRLSIIGSSSYELMSANLALGSLKLSGLAEASPTDFVLVMFVMAVGIIGSLVLASLLSKRILHSQIKLENRDKRWSALGSSTFLASVLTVLILPGFFKLTPSLLTFITSVIISLMINQIVKKTGLRILGDFSLAISMLLAITSSFLWTRLLTALSTLKYGVRQ
jgi:hypothetical protein